MRSVFEDWAMFGLADDVRPALSEALAAGRPSVLATLCGAVGGAPFGLGAQMLLNESSATGFLSGGCIEADVTLHAAEVLQDGVPRRLVYGEGGFPDIRLPCGGSVTIVVERIAPDDPAAKRLVALAEARRPALWLSDGERRWCLGLDEPTPPPWRHLIDGLDQRCGMEPDSLRHARRHDPAQALLVVGSDPIALSVCSFGLQMGWRTTLLRPLGPQAGPPIPGLSYMAADAYAGVFEASPDAWTAVVVATHGAEYDHPAAKAALESGAGYVGLLGSRRRLPERLDQLRRDGVSPGALDSVHAPVGLPIQARTPREVAVSVIGEIVESRHAHERAAGFWPVGADVLS